MSATAQYYTEDDLSEILGIDTLPKWKLTIQRVRAQDRMDWCFQNFSAAPSEENLRQLNIATLIYRHLVAIIIPEEG